MEIRTIQSSEFERFKQIINDSLFIVEEHLNSFSYLRRDMNLCDTRALFENGRMASVLRFIPFKVFFGNTTIPMGGISMVATPPEYRRHGYMRHMIEHILREMKERSFPISCLHTSSVNLYRRFGWDISSNLLEYSFSPDELREQPDVKGQILRFGKADIDTVSRVYETFARTNTCEIVRDKKHWETHVLLPNRHCYMWENPSGQVDAYLIYDIFDQSLPRTRSFGADIREIVMLNHEARQATFTFIKRLVPQIKKAVFKAPVPELYHSYFLNPRPDIKLIPGFMMRIVDIKQAFEMKEYPSDLNGEVRFRVRDEIAEWNNGCFSLQAEGGRGLIQNTTKAPHFTCDITTLSQIFCGHVDLFQAMDAGKISTSDTTVLPSVNRFFSDRTPCMHDWF